MKKYVKYQFKRALLPLAVIIFAGILIYVLPLMIPQTRKFAFLVEDMEIYLAVGLIAACIIMPVWAFRYKMNKRSTDLYFSLPIKRHKLLVTHYLSGFAAIVAGYTAVFWLGFIVIATKQEDFNLINMLWLYLVSVVFAYVIYSIYSFAYTRANNVIDGLIFMAFATCAVMMVAVLLNLLISTDYTYYYEDANGVIYSHTVHSHNIVEYWNYMTFMPLMVFEEFFVDLTVNGHSYSYFYPTISIEDINIIVSMVIFALLSAASTAGLVLFEKKNKSENCEQISDSPFGYKVMIPLYEIVLICCSINEGSAVIFLIVVAAGYFVTAIWQRSFKIGWKAFILYIASVAAGFGLGALINFVFY